MKIEDFYNRFDFNADASGSVIGRGGFSVVYKAYDKVRKRFVAIKRSEAGQDSKFDLKREVEIANEIDTHPNVLHYENVFRITESRLSIFDYAVMKYYPEGNLENVIRNYRLTPAEQKQIIAGILKGLEHIHKIPIIHRDFKTANILMDRTPDGDWTPLICDFGQSRLVDTTHSMVSNNSQIALTPKYSAPEQLRDAKTLRTNVDLWAFGVIVYQMIQGKLPFTVDDRTGDWGRSEKIRFLILQGDLPKDISSIREPYQQIIRKCLVTDPEKRVKSATTLLNNLEKYTAPVPPPFEDNNTLVDVTIINTPPHVNANENKTVLANNLNQKANHEIPVKPRVVKPSQPRPARNFNYLVIAGILVVIATILYFIISPGHTDITATLTKDSVAKTPPVVTTKETPAIDSVASAVNTKENPFPKTGKTETQEKTPDDGTASSSTDDSATDKSSGQSFIFQIVTNQDSEILIDGKKQGKMIGNKARNFNLDKASPHSQPKAYFIKLTNTKGEEINEQIVVKAGEVTLTPLNF